MTETTTITRYDENDCIDSDTSDKFMPPQSSRVRVGCRSGVSSGSDLLEIENIKSNLRKYIPLYSPAFYKCIGSCEDSDYMYFFVACRTVPDSAPPPYTDSIWRIDKATMTPEAVMLQFTSVLLTNMQVWTPNYNLHFDFNYLINNPKVCQGLLQWTETAPEGMPSRNQPMRINIQKAVNFCKNVLNLPNPYTYLPSYTNPYNEDLTVIKQQPTIPIVSYIDLLVDQNGQVIDYNNIKGQLFQLSNRYKYYDDEYSKYSGFSKVPLPKYRENIEGLNDPVNLHDNCIQLEINTGGESAVLIEIIARFGDPTQTIGAGAWYLVDTIYKYDATGNRLLQDNVSYIYNFLNNQTKTVIVQADALVLADDVPLFSNTQEILDEAILLLADNTEDKDPVTLDIKVDYINCEADVVSPWNTNLNIIKVTIPRTIDLFTSRTDYFYQIILPDISKLAAGETITIVVNTLDITMPEKTLVYTITANDIANGNSYLINNIVQALINNGVNSLTYIGTGGNIEPLAFDQAWINPIFTMFGLLIKYSSTLHHAFLNYNEYTNWYTNVAAELDVPTTATVNYKTWKAGYYHNFSLVYKDQYGRASTVNNPISEVYVEPQTNFYDDPVNNIVSSGKDAHGYHPPDNSFSYISQIYYIINHIPPIWAYSAQWVVQKPLYQFMYFVLGDFPVITPYSKLSDNYVGSLKVDGNNYKCYLNNAIKDLVLGIPNDILSVWDYQPGDRMRIVAKMSYVMVNGVRTAKPVLLDKIYDVGINGVSTTNPLDILIDQFVPPDPNGYSAPPEWDNCIVEVYRPLRQTQSEEDVWYEWGDPIQILEPGTSARRHAAGLAFTPPSNTFLPSPFSNLLPIGNEQVTSLQSHNPVPATGLLEGDVHFRMRYTGVLSTKNNIPLNTTQVLLNIPIEDVNYSDFYQSALHDYGKVNAIIRDTYQQRKMSQYNISLQKIRDSHTNGMSTFDALNSRVLNEADGRITGVRQIGEILKIIQEKKVTDYYLRALELSQQAISGAEGLITTDQIIGRPRPSIEKYGCTNAESILVFSDHVYFWDANNSAFIRNSYNGMQVISNYKQKLTFKNVAATQNNSLFRCYTGYDVKYSELHVTFVDEAPITNFSPLTLVFLESGQEGTGRWKSFQPWIPEQYNYMNGILMMWKNGQLWLHEQGGDYMVFFGVKYKQQISATGNGKLMGEKIWKSVEMRTNNNNIGANVAAWNVASAIVPPDSQNPSGMQTKIPVTKFVPKEQGIFAEFMKDINTPGNQPLSWKLINGRDMRGETIEVLFENDADYRVTVSNIKINSVESKSG